MTFEHAAAEPEVVAQILMPIPAWPETLLNFFLCLSDLLSEEQSLYLYVSSPVYSTTG